MKSEEDLEVRSEEKKKRGLSAEDCVPRIS